MPWYRERECIEGIYWELGGLKEWPHLPTFGAQPGSEASTARLSSFGVTVRKV